jgi:hypothetical protein
MAQVSRYCKLCKKQTLHEKPELERGMGCLLTICTAGIFLPFWIFHRTLILPFRPYRCQSCGKGRLT